MENPNPECQDSNFSFTRELAMQVSEELIKLTNILTAMALLIGGVSFAEQDNKLLKELMCLLPLLVDF